MKKENRKYLYIFFVIVVLVFSYLFIQFQENKSLKEKEEFIKQHNEKIKKVSESKKAVEVKKTENKTEVVEVEFDDVDLDKNERQILPYEKPLPPLPDYEESKKRFIDVNNNNVRDDVEIEIVEDYGSDRDLVEAIFADVRILQYDFYLVDNDLLNKDEIQFSLDSKRVAFECRYKYYNNSSFRSEESQFDYSKLTDIYYNTKERRKKFSKYFSQVGGYAVEGQKVNSEICQNFFFDSESWIIN